MKNLFISFLLLFSISGHAQDYCSWTILHGDLGGYQFSSEIVNILKTAREKNIKKIKFTLKEYRNDKDSMDYSTTQFLCNYSNDSTLEVIKYYLHNDFCVLFGYKLIYKHGLFIPLSTFPILDKVAKRYNCEDYFGEFKHKKRSDWTITSHNDSIIIDVKKDGWTYGVQLKDRIKYNTIYSDSAIYYLDSINRCIGINNKLQISYKGDDTVIFKNFYNDGSSSTSTLIQSTEEISDSRTLKTSKLVGSGIESEYYGTRKSKVVYTTNKQGFIEKIEVLNATNDPYKIKGSHMTIDY